MVNSSRTESEIRAWLEPMLKNEHFEISSVEILGTSEKGDGYSSDIIFVRASGTSQAKLPKEYNLVLKCSKKSQAFREKAPVKDTFLNEIYMYETVLPSFTRFQLERGVDDPFKVPKCYGSFMSEDTEVIVYENLKKNGYDLWDKKRPKTRKHIYLVINEYAKYHATSVAMNNQRPDEFQELVSNMRDTFQKFLDSADVDSFFGKTIDEVIDLLKDEVKENVIATWKKFRGQLKSMFTQEVKGLNVLLHGDCWNNNYMYKCNGIKESPTTVAILDWQISRLSSPIYDLSYYLFACISKEDLEDLDTILQDYHEAFSNRLRRLGSDPEKLYPLDQFLAEWKQYSGYGIAFLSLAAKIAATESDEAMDLAQAAEDGKDFAESFEFEVKNKEMIKQRAKPLFEYVVQHKLI